MRFFRKAETIFGVRVKNVLFMKKRCKSFLKKKKKKKNMGLSRFKKRSKFQKFQLNNFTLTCSNEGKMNSVWPDMTCSKEKQQK